MLGVIITFAHVIPEILMNLAADLSPAAKVAYLRSLPSIRERCSRVYEQAIKDQLVYWQYHPGKEGDVIDFCAGIMKRDFDNDFNSIPPHGRWRHFDVGGRSRISELISQWSSEPFPPNSVEVTKRLLDLFLVSVLLDAGAGSAWKYAEVGTGAIFSRSEGLAIASLDMFKQGLFSGDQDQPFRVDAAGLQKLSPTAMEASLQVDATSNPMEGIDGRLNLLSNLGLALRASPEYFGKDARPGNLIDFLEKDLIQQGTKSLVHISALWHVLIDGLAPIWPSARTGLAGVSLGDVWPCSALGSPSGEQDDSNLVPFHKLSQWLAYSLVEPIEKVLDWGVVGLEDMTGLPEYRNGGLLVDFGVLTLRDGVIPQSFYPDSRSTIPRLPPSHPAIIEWRAMTVIELDRIAAGIRTKLDAQYLSLPQVLESATWKGGREIAKMKRPSTGGPPVELESDGTVF